MLVSNIIWLSVRGKLNFSQGVAYLDLLRASSSGSCTVGKKKKFQLKEKERNWFYNEIKSLSKVHPR